MDIESAKIGLDVDGTLANFQRGVIKKAEWMDLPFYDHYTEWTTWMPEQNGHEKYQDTFMTVMGEVEEDKDFFLHSIPPIQKAHVPFEVSMYLSARGLAPDGVTAEWLDKHDFPPAEVKVVDDSQEKLDVLRESNLDVYVDDKVTTISQIFAMRMGGDDLPHPFLISNPPNTDVSGKMKDRFLHYLSELPSKIQRIDEQR